MRRSFGAKRSQIGIFGFEVDFFFLFPLFFGWFWPQLEWVEQFGNNEAASLLGVDF